MTDAKDTERLAGSVLSAAERKRLSRRPSDRAITTTLALTGLIAAFMQTLVTPIIPQLPTLLDTTAADSTWVLTSTLLAAAISTPISGRLGDMYGKRRIVLVLLIIMAGGSIISALSNTLIPMIVGRALQGVGLGVIALGISILRDVIHPKNLGAAVALVSATLGVGGAVGLPLAAVIAQNIDWHYLFWLAPPSPSSRLCSSAQSCRRARSARAVGSTSWGPSGLRWGSWASCSRSRRATSGAGRAR